MNVDVVTVAVVISLTSLALLGSFLLLRFCLRQLRERKKINQNYLQFLQIAFGGKNKRLGKFATKHPQFWEGLGQRYPSQQSLQTPLNSSSASTSSTSCNDLFTKITDDKKSKKYNYIRRSLRKLRQTIRNRRQIRLATHSRAYSHDHIYVSKKSILSSDRTSSLENSQELRPQKNLKYIKKTCISTLGKKDSHIGSDLFYSKESELLNSLGSLNSVVSEPTYNYQTNLNHSLSLSVSSLQSAISEPIFPHYTSQVDAEFQNLSIISEKYSDSTDKIYARIKSPKKNSNSSNDNNITQIKELVTVSKHALDEENKRHPFALYDVQNKALSDIVLSSNIENSSPIHFNISKKKKKRKKDVLQDIKSEVFLNFLITENKHLPVQSGSKLQRKLPCISKEHKAKIFEQQVSSINVKPLDFNFIPDNLLETNCNSVSNYKNDSNPITTRRDLEIQLPLPNLAFTQNISESHNILGTSSAGSNLRISDRHPSVASKEFYNSKSIEEGCHSKEPSLQVYDISKQSFTSDLFMAKTPRYLESACESAPTTDMFKSSLSKSNYFTPANKENYISKSSPEMNKFIVAAEVHNSNSPLQTIKSRSLQEMHNLKFTERLHNPRLQEKSSKLSPQSDLYHTKSLSDMHKPVASVGRLNVKSNLHHYNKIQKVLDIKSNGIQSDSESSADKSITNHIYCEIEDYNKRPSMNLPTHFMNAPFEDSLKKYKFDEYHFQDSSKIKKVDYPKTKLATKKEPENEIFRNYKAFNDDQSGKHKQKQDNNLYRTATTFNFLNTTLLTKHKSNPEIYCRSQSDFANKQDVNGKNNNKISTFHKRYFSEENCSCRPRKEKIKRTPHIDRLFIDENLKTYNSRSDEYIHSKMIPKKITTCDENKIRDNVKKEHKLQYGINNDMFFNYYSYQTDKLPLYNELNGEYSERKGLSITDIFGARGNETDEKKYAYKKKKLEKLQNDFRISDNPQFLKDFELYSDNQIYTAVGSENLNKFGKSNYFNQEKKKICTSDHHQNFQPLPPINKNLENNNLSTTIMNLNNGDKEPINLNKENKAEYYSWLDFGDVSSPEDLYCLYAPISYEKNWFLRTESFRKAIEENTWNKSQRNINEAYMYKQTPRTETYI